MKTTPFSVSGNKTLLIVLSLAVMALVAKLYCASSTVGSTDVSLFFKFGGAIHKNGLLETYKNIPYFNHTPLIGSYVEWVYQVTSQEGGVNRQLFSFLIRLPSILADFTAVAVLLFFKKELRLDWRILAVFAVSPVSFMISGFHGNVDSVMALLLMLAGISCFKGWPLACGVFLGLACNIKVVSVLLIPAFFFFYLPRNQWLRFGVPLLLIMLGGWCYPLVSIPKTYLANVFGYGSVSGVWGVTSLLRMLGVDQFQDMTLQLQNTGMGDGTTIQTLISSVLKWTVILSVMAVSWIFRKRERTAIFQTLALCWALFFTLAPGFGAQYLVWLAPIVLLTNSRWYLALTFTSSIALFVFYTAICSNGGTFAQGIPWNMGSRVSGTFSVWVPWFLLPWVTITLFLVFCFRQFFKIKTMPDTLPVQGNNVPVR